MTDQDGVAVSWSRRSEILHEDRKDYVSEETANEDLARDVANVPDDDSDNEDTDSCGDEALPGLQEQLEYPTLARSALQNTGHFTEVCSSTLYSCQRLWPDAKGQKVTQATKSDHFCAKNKKKGSVFQPLINAYSDRSTINGLTNLYSLNKLLPYFSEHQRFAPIFIHCKAG